LVQKCCDSNRSASCFLLIWRAVNSAAAFRLHGGVLRVSEVFKRKVTWVSPEPRQAYSRALNVEGTSFDVGHVAKVFPHSGNYIPAARPGPHAAPRLLLAISAFAWSIFGSALRTLDAVYARGGNSDYFIWTCGLIFGKDGVHY
jgi:hypothetical protein